MNALGKDLMRLVAFIERHQGEQVQADPRRLRFHLMPPVGWMNDPNGLCEFRGETHVFYQYGPFDATGGVKFWGHYKSRDLLTWDQCPPMLCPDETWDVHGVYSGSALIEDDTMYLYYTGNVKHVGNYNYVTDGREQNTGLCISRDGLTFESNEQIMSNADFPADESLHVRDPKVWKQDGKYYMVQGARTRADVGEMLVFESTDKVHWSVINRIQTPAPYGYMWECPDLYQVDGQWIVSMSPQGIKQQGHRFQNVYTVGYFPLYGDFRGEYTLGDFTELDFGTDFYASQTFERDGKRLLIGWVGMPDAPYTNPTVADGWQHCMTVPRELHWNGSRLTMQPAQELDALRADVQTVPVSDTCRLDLTAGSDLQFADIHDTLIVTWNDDLYLTWKDGMLTLRWSERAGYGRTERFVPVERLDNLRVLVDTSVVEIFANDGQYVMTARYYPAAGSPVLEVSGPCTLTVAEMNALAVRPLEQEGK